MVFLAGLFVLNTVYYSRCLWVLCGTIFRYHVSL